MEDCLNKTEKIENKSLPLWNKTISMEDICLKSLTCWKSI